MQYPHGIILEQSRRRNFYRGENKIYPESVPTLLRTLDKYHNYQDKELYRLVADMRIGEFKILLQKFKHVKEWKYCDILFDALAQHYGLETGWLDITSDFKIALFFATCYYDSGEKKWLPLTKKQTEWKPSSIFDTEHGMIFHMPSNLMANRWLLENYRFSSITSEVVGSGEDDLCNRNIVYDFPPFNGQVPNLIYPLGFQPFMRCHMQDGYGIFMRTKQPLQQDEFFEKLRFKHNEKLSREVYEMMGEGNLIYPHEGLKEIEFLIDEISNTYIFSEDAFQYALYRSHAFKLSDSERCRQELNKFEIKGNKIKIVDSHSWHLSSGRRKKLIVYMQIFQ